jgi:3-oxoacyl-[acyl-carrier protein] reductase
MGLLEGKTAIITGSGRGIGAAAAKLFAEHGANVVVTDIDPAPAEETASAIRAANGKALSLVCDVTKDADIEELIGQTVNTFGAIDILVNNAGYTWDGMIHKMTDAQWDAMLAVHLTAPFRIIRAAIPYMRGNIGQANYAAGKAGIIGLTKTLSKEWGAFNIQVNAVAFGWIATRLTQDEAEGGFTEREGTKIKLGMPEKIRQMSMMAVPMGRAGTPEEAAGALLFFASDLSNYVSGQVLEVTGGW